MTDPDVLILGGGAAGLMCAIVAGRRGRRVVVLDHANRVGKKILMSGGGRCNFTNLDVTPEHYLSANPHFCKSALARYTQWDFIAMVQQHRIAYHEKELGQLFCDESSKLILNMLLRECEDAGVEIRTDCRIERVAAAERGFDVLTPHDSLHCESLVVATGGLSIPRMGATGLGYALARQFGHTIRPTRAGLVPLTLGDADLQRYGDLSGLATPVEAHCHDASFGAGLLFTHRGLSGPAILQVSSYWQPGDTVTVNWLPGTDALAWLQARQQERPAAELRTVLAEVLPKRLAQRLCELGPDSRPLKQYPPRQLQQVADALQAWRFTPDGSEGYRTAEVTLGGVDTDALSSSTMGSRHVDGLYFVGEVVDVTGHLGGYNFQWAWASGHAAGQVV
ncbi:MAG: NAD(P)/FAD-dependent oxidoreductase [Nevskiales bacterium]|nr:NAD(P)/FAD-dependent oxidoreductase [Nevskiales bacterium]